MKQSNSSMEGSPFLPALVLLGTFCLVVAFLLAMQPKPPVSETAALPTQTPTEIPATPTVEPTPEPEAVAAAAYDAAQVAQGQSVYSSTCTACHGPGGRGIPGLGKDLISSEFVHSLNDEELLQFIIVGRRPWDEGNTTGIDMPARGGNPNLPDEDINAIIAYIRAETQNAGISSDVAVQPTAAEPTVIPTQAEISTDAAPAPAISAPSEDMAVTLPVEPRNAETTYNQLCAGCHGAGGEGTTNNGPAITDSTLLDDEAALTEFLTQAEQIMAQQGFAHPYRGGYPPLLDEEIQPLIDYLHGLTAEE